MSYRIYITKSRAGHYVGTVRRISADLPSYSVFSSEKCSTAFAARHQAQQYIDAQEA